MSEIMVSFIPFRPRSKVLIYVVGDRQKFEKRKIPDLYNKFQKKFLNFEISSYKVYTQLSFMIRGCRQREWLVVEVRIREN